MHLKQILLLTGCLLSLSIHKNIPDSQRAANARLTVLPKLQQDMLARGFSKNAQVYIRLFKGEDLLEVWLRKKHKFELFKSYVICFYSGGLGPKTKTGDGQSPEGFYTITPGQLNLNSSYHLSINIGYPNQVERSKGWTGSAIMIHGHCASIGCYAMTDSRIEEIYTLVYNALSNGQATINLDIYPFRLDKKHFSLYSDTRFNRFWQTMKPGYDRFEKTHIPATPSIRG